MTTAHSESYPLVTKMIDLFGEWLVEALGIDEAAIRRAQPTLLRDMERVCAYCAQKRQCNQELVAGTASSNYAQYCGNADSLDELTIKG